MPHCNRRRRERGTTTAEYAVGVVAAVLLAALLLALVLDGFFDQLLGSLFGRVLDAAQILFSNGTATFALSEIASRAGFTLTGAVSTTAGWIESTTSGTAGVAGSTASSLAGSAWSSLFGAGSAVLDAATGALRWVGGPVSEAFR